MRAVELWEDDGIRDPDRLNAAVTIEGRVHVMRVEWQIGFYYRFEVDPRAVADVFAAIVRADLRRVPVARGRSFPVRIVLIGEDERHEIACGSDCEPPAFATCHALLRKLVDPRPRDVRPYHHGGPWHPHYRPFP